MDSNGIVVLCAIIQALGVLLVFFRVDVRLLGRMMNYQPATRRELVMTILACGSIALSLYSFFYAGERVRSRERWQYELHHLETIRGRAFKNEEVELDGKSFLECKFEGVTLVFRGEHPFALIGADIKGNGGALRIRVSPGPVSAGAEMVQLLLREMCRDPSNDCHPNVLDIDWATEK